MTTQLAYQATVAQSNELLRQAAVARRTNEFRAAATPRRTRLPLAWLRRTPAEVSRRPLLSDEPR